jgi:4-hydroxythreonine-4-phosphate dehydrogenase
MSNNNLPIVITPGEPAGIGPDIVLQLASEKGLPNCLVVADPHLLEQRAKQLNLNVGQLAVFSSPP